MKFVYDDDADALYVEVTSEPVSRTEQVDGGTLVDLDRLGAVVGIEVLRPARSWPVNEILSRFPVGGTDRASLEAMFGPDAQLQTFPYVSRTAASVA